MVGPSSLLCCVPLEECHPVSSHVLLSVGIWAGPVFTIVNSIAERMSVHVFYNALARFLGRSIAGSTTVGLWVCVCSAELGNTKLLPKGSFCENSPTSDGWECPLLLIHWHLVAAVCQNDQGVVQPCSSCLSPPGLLLYLSSDPPM